MALQLINTQSTERHDCTFVHAGVKGYGTQCINVCTCKYKITLTCINDDLHTTICCLELLTKGNLC